MYDDKPGNWKNVLIEEKSPKVQVMLHQLPWKIMWNPSPHCLPRFKGYRNIYFWMTELTNLGQHFLGNRQFQRQVQCQPHADCQLKVSTFWNKFTMYLQLSIFATLVKNCAVLPQGIHSNFNTWYWFVRPAYDLYFCLTLFLFSWYFPFIVINLFFHQTATVYVIQKWENSLTWNLIMFLCALDIIFQQHQHFQQCIHTPVHDGFVGVTQTTRYQNYIYLGNKVTTTFGAVSAM